MKSRLFYISLFLLICIFSFKSEIYSFNKSELASNSKVFKICHENDDPGSGGAI